MKKSKFFSVVLAFVILLTCSMNSSVNVLAIAPIIIPPTITVSSAEGNPGDQVAVTVSLSNNPGICTIRLAINYDSKLTLTAVDNGSIMSDYVFGKQLTANPYYVTWDESLAQTDNTQNGTLVTLTFEIAENATAGDLPVSVSYRSGEIYNLELDDIDFEVVNGKVTVLSSSTSDPIPVTNIELDTTETNFDKGGTFQLSATVLPNNATDKTVTWSSNNESVATVDSNGLVTGVKNGTATITASSKDGTVQATCTVTINCIHDQKTAHSEKDSTCVEQGNDSYYTCDDCGKIFDASGVTELETVPFRPLGNHTGGTATCTNLAVCSVCGHTYGDYGAHSYTAQTKSEEMLKTAGTCSEEAVYYYSCSVCGTCEHNDAHVFYGEKDATNHDGETEIRNAKEATCCEDGYTGDTYCKDCNTKIASGSIIPATGNHTDADGNWETNGTQHWHTCYYGTQFDVASHTGGTATCTEKAKCSVCGVEYGDYAGHTLTHHDRVDPDYESDGNIEYWTCDECGKYFEDADGHNEISANDIVIPKLIVTEYQFIDGEVIIEAPDGAIPDGSIFDVQKIVPPPAEVVEKVKDQIGSTSEALAYYEIRLFDTNGELIIHLDGEITIKMQIPSQYVGNKYVRIIQEDESGKLIEMESWWESECLCFKTDWLENYDN